MGKGHRSYNLTITVIVFFVLCCFLLGGVESNRVVKNNAPGLNGEITQHILRKNTVGDENKKKQTKGKKVQPNSKSSNLSREARIRAMGPNGLTVIKKNTESKIRMFQGKLNRSKDITETEKEFKFHLLELFIEELTESERDMLEAQEALKNSLLTDFRDPAVLMQNSKIRLDALRIATLKEEQSYNRIKHVEEAMKLYTEHSNDSKSMMDEFLKEIADAADQLELDIEDVILPMENAVVDGAHIEAVIHMKEGEEHIQDAHNNSDIDSEVEYDERLDMLVDSQNNKFILTRPKDMTSPNIDHYLILDIIMIYIASFPFGYICQFFGVPSIFGYIMAGLTLGPSGLNWIQALVQVESFGEFGVFMIMFFAGLEFSLEKVKKVWKVSVQASVLINVIMIICGLIIGSLLNYNIPKGESAFIAVCMSMSSTPLVVRFLQDSSAHEAVDYSSILLAMLVMQDVQLGIIVATLPAFAPTSSPGVTNAIMYTTVTLLRTIGSLALVIFILILLTKYFVPKFLNFVSNQTKEIQLLGALMFMFLFQLSTNQIGISTELGCFLAGFLISISNYHSVFEKIMSPIHDLFVILFFATVGFHVFPKFVVVELTYLVWLTAAVIGGKYLIALLVLHFTLPRKQRQMKWLIAGGLAQVSEFAFVLGSRARHLKIVTREVFLLILSTTTLSLIFAPVMWKLSLRKFQKTMHIT
ncbi:transmembrane and coiled-coil domain-containing protein 3-like [Styela clava]